jgi:hypothetical protein
MRPDGHSAGTGRLALPRVPSPARLAVAAALAAVAVFVLMQAAGGSDGESRTPAFLRDALGASDASAPVVPLSVTSGKTSVALAMREDGATTWNRFENGVSRATSYGAETIVLDGPTTEQFLTVSERQGIRTWRWRIESNRLPRVGDDGAVAFLERRAHQLTDVAIAPVKILDADGRNVTPGGLRWGVERKAGAWWLALRVDDTRLPIPYVVDPSITHRTDSTNAVTSTSITMNKPTGAAANDVLVAQIAIDGNTVISTVPANWTQIQNTNNGNALRQATYYHVVAASGEPASYQWDWGSTTRNAVGGISAYYGVKSSSPFDFASTQVSANGNPVTANSVTPTFDNAVVIAFFASAGGTAFTQPAGWAERYDVSSASAVGISADDIFQTTKGASGNQTSTATAGGKNLGHQAAFKVDDVAPLGTMDDPGSPLTGPPARPRGRTSARRIRLLRTRSPSTPARPRTASTTSAPSSAMSQGTRSTRMSSATGGSTTTPPPRR